MLGAIAVLEALLHVAETKASCKGKSSLVSSVTGNVDDDANVESACLTPPELSASVSVREILEELNKDPSKEEQWTSEQGTYTRATYFVTL